MLLPVEISSKRKLGVADRNKSSAFVPIHRPARVDIVGEHIALVEKKTGGRSDTLQPVDVDDLVGRSGRAAAAKRAQERSPCDAEVGGRKRGKVRAGLAPIAVLQREGADFDGVGCADVMAGAEGEPAARSTDRTKEVDVVCGLKR